jgi:isopenicillin-N epimerase
MKHWGLDPAMVFLNHGSFGATPIKILELQHQVRQRMESEPVRFMVREFEPLWWEAKNKLGDFVGAKGENLVFVKNATMGVNNILHALAFEEGDEVLTTNHVYGACLNTLHQYAKIKKFKVVIADIPFPIKSKDDVMEALISKVSTSTKLLLIDHITSATGLIFPVEEIVKEFEGKGIEVLVDGAHAPGFLPLSLEQLGASYYVGNCHKWICSPKGSAILHVRKDKQEKIHPLQYSHIHDRKNGSDDEWSAQFFWPGTDDISAYLCVPEAIKYMGNMLGSWEELRNNNKQLIVNARNLLSKTLSTDLPVPEKNIGFISNILIDKADILNAKSKNLIFELYYFTKIRNSIKMH